MADDEELDDRISRFQSLSISFIFSNREPTKRKIPSEIKEKLKSAAGEKCPLCPNTMISSSIKKTPLHERESTPDHILDLGLVEIILRRTSSYFATSAIGRRIMPCRGTLPYPEWPGERPDTNHGE